MANKITKDEIADKDLFDNIVKSANTAIDKINELNTSFASLGSSLKESVSKIKVDDIKGIKELLTISKESERLAREKIKTDKELLDLATKKQEAEKKLLSISQKIAQQKAESDAKMLKSEMDALQKIEESNAKMLRSKKETNAKILVDKKESIAKIEKAQKESDARIATQDAKTAEIRNKINIQNQKEADRIAKQNQREAEKQAKANEKAEKQAKDLADAYKRLSNATRDLKNQSKTLGAEMLELERDGKKNTDEYRKLALEYKHVTTEANLADKALKKLDAKVGDNFRNVGNYRNAVNKLSYALGQMGLAFGVFEGLRYFVDAQVQLNTLQLSLRSVSKDTQEFNDNFQFASEVSKRYGQDINKIVDTYKNFIASTNESNVSLARRKELYEQIIKAGSTLALSNDDIEGTLRAVGQIFSKGTVQSEELRQQLGERLPGAFNIMAKAIGVSEVELNKMLKDGVVLAEDVMPLFGKELERQFGTGSTNKLKTLGGAWNLLKTNIVLTIDEAGKGIKTTERLAGVIRYLGENIGGILKSLVVLTTSFATYRGILSMTDGSIRLFAVSLADMVKGLFGMKQATDEVSASTVKMQSIIKGIGWTALIAVLTELAMKFYDVASGAKRAREEFENYQKALKKGEDRADKYLSKKETEIDRLKLEYLVKIRKATDDVTKANLRKEATQKINQKRDEMEAEILKKIQIATDKKNKAELERQRIVNQSKYRPIQSIEAGGKRVYKDYTTEEIAKFQQQNKPLIKAPSFMESNPEWEKDRKNYREATDIIIDYTKEIITYKNELKNSQTVTEDFGKSTEESSKKVGKAVKNYTAPIQAIKFEFKDLEEYVIDVNQALRDLQEIANKTELDNYNKSLDKAVERSSKLAKLFFYKDNSFLKTQQGMTGISNFFKSPTGLGVNENILPQEIFEDYRKEIRKASSEFERIQIEEGLDQTLLNIAPQIIGSEEYQKIIQNLDAIQSLRKKQIDIEANYKKKKLQEEYKEKSDKEKEFYDKQIEAFKDMERMKVEITYQNDMIAVDNMSSLSEKQKSSRKGKLGASQQKALDAVNDIFRRFEEKNTKTRTDNEVKRKEELDTKIRAIDAETDYEYKQLQDEKLEKTKDINEQIVESAKEGMESMKDTARSVYEYINLILEMMVTQSERRLEQLGLNLDKVKEKQSKLTQLAVNGNIEATESLALNEKEQARIQKNIEREQRRIEMLKLAQSVYSTYASYASNPEIKNPLTKTVSDMTVLSQFVKTLPTFYKGTETDVKTALGNPDLQGKDGYIVRVDGSEKILNPRLSAMTGNMTTYEIAKLAEEHRLGKLVKSGDGAIQIKNNWETNLLIDKLDSLEKTIMNKSETNIEVGEILGGVMHIVETTKKPNTIVRNIRRYS
jgi:tape measure domain-containing protein